jgi:hypothetical protein
MIKIEIPIIDVDLIIFIGSDGLEEFKKEIKKDNKEWEPDKKMAGYAAENYIWLYEYKRKTLIHELIHFLDWLYVYVGCENETEFKAFLGEYIIENAIKRFEI